jgi:large subunit ribosomal protein L2
MALKKFNPTSAGRRFMTVLTFDEITKTTPEKALTEPKKRTGGRNNTGRQTFWFRGGGHKQRYRVVGSTVVTGEGADILPGNCLPLKAIPAGTMIHNIELRHGKGGQMVRSAGGAAQLVAKEGEYAQVKLPSGEVRKVHVDCLATVGQIGNIDHKNVSYGKAGRKRWLGRRPHNRGVAMNPVDHPHGGGEGKTSGGRHPVTPWGKPTKGAKTRNNKRTQAFIVKRRK